MATTIEQTGAERANRMYWDSEYTIDEIVDELGMSRNALYGAVRPVSAGTACPECGERMVFTNRTNRAGRKATCRDCGTELEAGDRAQAAEAAGRDRPVTPGEREDERDGWTRWRHELTSVPAERYALVGGAAALGVVMGAAATRAIR